MVLEHVEEDEDAVTKDKADEKQKMVITFFYPEKKKFRKIFSDFDENLHVGQGWGTDKPHWNFFWLRVILTPKGGQN